MEYRLPYRDAGTENPTRKRAYMMALTGCAQCNFSVDARLIMDVTIGHVFDTHHNFKTNTLRSLSNSKCIKYTEHYQQQHLAFAPIVADTLQVLRNLADHQGKNTFGFAIDLPANTTSQFSPPST